MPRLTSFMQISLDGYFTGPPGDTTLPRHSDDPEWNAFVEGNASDSTTLVFGRVTYEMMVAWWPTPMARQAMPKIAKGMNEARKLVFSRTRKSVDWQNAQLERGDAVATLRRLKQERGPDLTILGSGNLVAQLAGAGLIDDYQLVVTPVALGRGRTMFEGLPSTLELTLVSSQTFGNGNVVLNYSA